MTCPCLKGTYLKTCSAPPDVYSPSQFQVEEYCTNAWHPFCPLFRMWRPQHALRQRQAGQQQAKAETLG